MLGYSVMARKCIGLLVLLAVVSCQSQTSTDRFELQNNTSVSASTSSSNETAIVPSVLTTTDNNTFSSHENDTSPQVETSTNDYVGIDDGDSGKADDLADYLTKTIEKIFGAESDTEAVTQPDPSASHGDLQNCSLPPTLDRYSNDDIPAEVYEYFNNDVSVRGILSSLFKSSVVEVLQSNCSMSWCLPFSYHQDIIDSKSEFFGASPICSSAMGSCLENMLQNRKDCAEPELNFLINVKDLLCTMEDYGLSGECFATTVEALYVTYVDMINPNGSQKASLKLIDCNNFKVEMVKMYLCADDVCNYDQNLLLERFAPWAGMTQTAAETAKTCNISRLTCQSDDYDADYNTYPYPNYDNYNDFISDQYEGQGDGYYDGTTQPTDELEDEDSYVTDLENEMKDEANEIAQEGNEYNEDNQQLGGEQTGNANEINTHSDDGYDQQNRSMLLGIIVMTTALLLGFVGLAFVVYRRFKRARGGNYRWGYSQLTTEEGKQIAQNDYK